MAGHVRALMLDAGRRLGRELAAASALYPWAVRHASFLHNRLQPQQHGATPFEQMPAPRVQVPDAPVRIISADEAAVCA